MEIIVIYQVDRIPPIVRDKPALAYPFSVAGAALESRTKLKQHEKARPLNGLDPVYILVTCLSYPALAAFGRTQPPLARVSLPASVQMYRH